MGPFPHDAPPATISAQNPIGTDGFEFVEFAHPRPDELAKLFVRMGYTPVARHKTKAITVYRQGDINYILNAEPDTFASRFVAQHGPCAASMAWRVVDAEHAFEHAVSHGAEPYDGADKTLGGAGDQRHRRLAALFHRPLSRWARPMTRNSTGPARAIRSRTASASITSTI